jgi:hypothetical protein
VGWMNACAAGSASDSGLQGPGVGAGAASAVGGTGGTNAAIGQSSPPAEQETEQSYTAPVVSGHWIWTANPLSGKVALIDAATKRVTTADAGLAPTYIAALGESDDTDSSAIVLNIGDDTASILQATSGDISVQSVHVHPDANRLTVSPSGRWAIVWSDATLIANPDPTEGLQDVTVLDLGVTPAASYPLTVGYRPSRVSLGTGEQHAYFVTEPGISVVDLPDTDPPSVARDVTVTQTPEEAASVRDVTVTPDGSVAVVRHDGSPNVSVISLDDGSEVDVTLPGPVTDLDLAPDGKTAFAVVRGAAPSSGTGGGASAGAGGSSATGGSDVNASGGTNAVGAGTGGTTGNLNASGQGNAASGTEGGQSGANEAGAAGQVAGGAPSGGGAPGEAGAPGAGGPDAGAPGAAGGTAAGGSGGIASSSSYVAALRLSKVLDDPTAFDEVAIDDQVGSIVIAPEGDVALLYTNAIASDHVIIFDTKSFAVVRTVLVESPVKAVLASPDGLHAVAVLGQASGSQKPGGFSLIPLTTTLPPKIVGTDAPPQSVALGLSQALITVDGTDPVKNVPVHAVYLAQLPAFGTTEVTLASPPISAGLIVTATDPVVNLGFVAQSHPEGRITFLDLDSGQPQTLTGFELASRVVQGD